MGGTRLRGAAENRQFTLRLRRISEMRRHKWAGPDEFACQQLDTLIRELSPGWIEYQVGGNTLALARPSRTAADAPTPDGSASLQLAFKVAAPEVDRCADELSRQGIPLLSPPTDQPFGHRTLFFRDPDGNLLEVFADI